MNWPSTYLRLPNLEQNLNVFSFCPIRYEDRETIREWRNCQTSVLRQNVAITSEEQETYFKSVILPDFFSLEPKQILVGMRSNKTLIAYGGLVHIDWLNRHAELSFLTSGQMAATNYKFIFHQFISFAKLISKNDLNLHKLVTETFAFRTQEIQILEQNGFAREGQLNDQYLKGDTFINSILHGAILG